jgi:hypothetical protein
MSISTNATGKEMSVSTLSESLSYARDLNKHRDEIIETLRRYENESMKLSLEKQKQQYRNLD